MRWAWGRGVYGNHLKCVIWIFLGYRGPLMRVNLMFTSTYIDKLKVYIRILCWQIWESNATEGGFAAQIILGCTKNFQRVPDLFLRGFSSWVAVFSSYSVQGRPSLTPLNIYSFESYTKFTCFQTCTPLFRKYTQRCFAERCTKVILIPATEKNLSEQKT